MPSRLILLLLPIILIGCSSIEPMHNSSESTEVIPMAPPFGPPRQIIQKITAPRSNQQKSFICVLELSKDRIAIAGLSEEGMSLFNLSYDGKSLVSDKSPLLTTAFFPEFIIKDLQLIFWPTTELQKILPDQWHIESDKLSRRLYYKDEIKVSIDVFQPDERWAKLVKLTNHNYLYQLEINTLSYETLPE